MEPKTILHSPLADIYLEEGILHISITQEQMTLENIQAHLAFIQQHFAGQLPLPSVTESGKMKGGTKESRDFISGEEVTSVISCNAMIATSLIGRTLGNLFLLLNKPQTPSKLFADKAKAVEWAKQFKR